MAWIRSRFKMPEEAAVDTQAVALLSPEDTGHGNGNGHASPPAAECRPRPRLKTAGSWR